MKTNIVLAGLGIAAFALTGCSASAPDEEDENIAKAEQALVADSYDACMAYNKTSDYWLSGHSAACNVWCYDRYCSPSGASVNEAVRRRAIVTPRRQLEIRQV